MCPFCISTLGLIVVGSVSTGGLAALAVKISRKKNSKNDAQKSANGENDHDGTEK